MFHRVAEKELLKYMRVIRGVRRVKKICLKFVVAICVTSLLLPADSKGGAPTEGSALNPIVLFSNPALSHGSFSQYLAFLEKNKALGLGWYERLDDSRYKYHGGRGQEKQDGVIFNRRDLMTKYGFTK